MHLHMMSTTMEYMINIACNSSSMLNDTYYDIKSLMQLLSFIIFDANLFFNLFFLPIFLFFCFRNKNFNWLWRSSFWHQNPITLTPNVSTSSPHNNFQVFNERAKIFLKHFFDLKRKALDEYGDFFAFIEVIISDYLEMVDYNTDNKC